VPRSRWGDVLGDAFGTRAGPQSSRSLRCRHRGVREGMRIWALGSSGAGRALTVLELRGVSPRQSCRRCLGVHTALAVDARPPAVCGDAGGPHVGLLSPRRPSVVAEDDLREAWAVQLDAVVVGPMPRVVEASPKAWRGRRLENRAGPPWSVG
jgi:hypothetical protein